MKKAGATIILAALLAVLLAAGCKGDDEPDETAAERYVVMGGRLVLYSGNAADVIVPDGTASIGNNAFKGCARLEKVFIPASVTYIAGGAFRGVDIGYMAYGDTVARWEEVVAGSSGLAASLAGLSVVCTDGVWNAPTDPGDEPDTPGIWQITDGVLTAYTGSGAHVTVPAGVTTIAEGAFAGTDVTAADLPASVTRIEPGAFADGTVLTYHGTREEWERLLENGDLTGLTVFAVDDDGVLVGYSGNETHVTIPDGVTAVGEGAFAGHSEITDVTIPGSVTAIGEGAFKGCTGLTDVTVPGSVTDIGAGAFEGCDSLTNVTYGGTREDLEELVGGSGIDLSKVTVIISDEASVWDIRDGVLVGYYGSETDIVIPDGVTAIGEGAFAGNTNLTSVTIPDGVTSIGGGAFGGSGITDISYGGTMAEWDALVKAGGIADEVADITVTCADGTWTPEHRHTWGEGYTDGGDGTHYQTCTECGNDSAPEEHDCDVVYEADGHHKTCTACDYAEVEEHDYDGAPYVDDENGKHYQTCTATGCGAHSATEAHDCEYEDNGDGTHTATCTKCAYSQSAEEHRYEDGTCVDCKSPQPTTVYVASTGSDDNPGSRTKPFATIQKALDTVIAWNDGTGEYTIYVDGTLTQSAAASDGKDGMADFSALDKNLTLTIKALSGTATLDGGARFDSNGNVTNAGIGKGVIFAKSKPDTDGKINLTLENLTITGGNKAGNGAGVYLNSPGGTLTIGDGTTISGNRGGFGGGISINSGAFTMTGGTVSGNWSTENSGGVDIGSGGASFTMTGGTISGNTAQYGGGMLVASGGTVTMIGGGITGNTATGNGGGVYNRGTFAMSGSAKISGNTANEDGGGVYVIKQDEGNAEFTMEDGTVSDNTANYGGGVYVKDGGTFTMKKGAITGNEANSGGGVYVYSRTFTMSGGTIAGNIASSNGGGVYVYSGTFTMSGGEISNCTATNGGGVFINASGTFNMSGTAKIAGCKMTSTGGTGGGGIYNAGTVTITGGTISGCTSAARGGGVYVNSGTFTMSGGTIAGNIASSNGGGVYVYSGTFTMSGGEISNCTASSYGGGVFITSSGTFNMSGTAKIAGCKMTSTSGRGGGVYVSGGTFTMGGAASVPAGEDGKNDVYLIASGSSVATIIVAGALTATAPVATITLPASAYVAGTQVLTAGTGVTITDGICDKFKLTPASDDATWEIAPDGTGASGVIAQRTYTFKVESGGTEIAEGSELPQSATITLSEVRRDGVALTESDGTFLIELTDGYYSFASVGFPETSATGLPATISLPPLPPSPIPLLVYIKAEFANGIVIEEGIEVLIMP